MDKKTVTDNAVEYVTGLFKDNSDGHDIEHTMRVYRNSLLIAESEECDIKIVELAALLHDVDDHKLFDTKDNKNARDFLKSQGIDDAITDRICDAINAVSFSKNRGRRPETIEGMIVQDADRIDALGAVGIVRTFAYGGKHGRSIEDSIEHFYDKLFLIKDELNTDKARMIAEGRHAYMESFIEELREELK